MNSTEFKRELGKIAGIDFFNPKFRDVFKRHLASTRNIDTEEEIEREEVKAEDNHETHNAPAVEIEVDVESGEEESKVEIETEEEEGSETSETEILKESKEDSAEEKALKALLGEEYEVSVGPQSQKVEEIEIATEAESVPAINLADQLQETKLELELVKAGVREERLDLARRLLLPEIKTGTSIEEIRGKIPPEWIGKKGGAQGFGMPLGDKMVPLTAEEKALRKMGIDPRD